MLVLMTCSASTQYLHSYINFDKCKNTMIILVQQVQIYDELLPQSCQGFQSNILQTCIIFTGLKPTSECGRTTNKN